MPATVRNKPAARAVSYPSPAGEASSGEGGRSEATVGWGHSHWEVPPTPTLVSLAPPLPTIRSRSWGEGSDRVHCNVLSHPSDVTPGRERARIETRRVARDHRGDRSARRRSRGEADMLVAEGEPQALMPRRLPYHRQTIRQGRPRPAPGFGHG